MEFSSSAGLSSAAGEVSSAAESSSSAVEIISSSSLISVSSSLASSSVSAALYPSYNTNPIAPDMTGMESDALQLAAKFKLGVNIGNTMEAYGCTPAAETCWGNPMVSEAYIKLMKDSGVDAVRIPVSWDQYANQQTAEISAAWLNRVKQVVQSSVDNGLYVIVNIHWDGGWLERQFSEPLARDNKGPVTDELRAKVDAKQKAYWEQIATTLRDFDEHVIFASANEPDAETEQDIADLERYHQTFVDAVRSTGGKNAYRVLVLQAPKTNIDKAATEWHNMPSDTATGRQMVEVHFYPFNFTIMDKDESWGKMAYYWGRDYHSITDPERNATWGEEDYVDAQFASMKAKFVDRGIPVVLGEFTAIYRSQLTGDALTLHRASRAYFHQYVTQKALENGMLPFIWEIGASPGWLFDRRTPAVGDQQVMDALLIGAGKKSSSSSSSSVASSSKSSASSKSSSSSTSSSSSKKSSSSSNTTSSSSSASNLVVLDTSPSKWNMDNGVVKTGSTTHIEFTVNASNQGASYESATPIDMTGATISVVFNFDEAFVTNRSGGMDGIMQFYAYSPSWANSQFTCWTGWTALVADQDVTFTCSNITLVDAVGFGFQFFATEGTIKIKSATIQLDQ
ncbi:cellulase family glycosylhydrolase [Cellvibrio fontiphilus]|uniref:Cellulase family glycosylhydrolase n=1 Tax=Cellvibrio fontiphilus TaxID=1815559 RepID=A0ABV7FFF3_9GAMM